LGVCAAAAAAAAAVAAAAWSSVEGEVEAARGCPIQVATTSCK